MAAVRSRSWVAEGCRRSRPLDADPSLAWAPVYPDRVRCLCCARRRRWTGWGRLEQDAKGCDGVVCRCDSRTLYQPLVRAITSRWTVSQRLLDTRRRVAEPSAYASPPLANAPVAGVAVLPWSGTPAR